MPRAAFRSPHASPPRSSLRVPRHGHTLPPPPGHRRTLSATVMEESLRAAAAVVQKWHPDGAAGCSLFLDSRGEADAFLRAAADLHRAMLFVASDAAAAAASSSSCSGSGDELVHAQALLETAMRRLELELQLLLASMSHAGDQDGRGEAAVADVRAVAEAMVAAGYGKECVAAYKERRRAAVDAAVLRLLGFPPGHHAQLHKLSWEQVDAKVRSWLAAAPAAFKSLFPGERALCDTVFAGDAAVCGALFAAIASEQAVQLLAIAEAAAARARRAPERLFRVLDLHDAIAEFFPAIAAAFGHDSEPAARAAAALARTAESARAALAGFEAAIQKEPARAVAPGGAVLPLTRYVMNYLVFLADYEEAVTDIYTDVQPGDTHISGNASPELVLSPSPSPSSTSNTFAWLISVLLRKLEAKAGSYREAALRCLFMANNVHYIAKKVAGGKLEEVLGEEWVAMQKAKARRHVDAYVRAAWGGVAATLTAANGEDGGEEEVEAAVAAQEEWAVADAEMAAALRVAVAAMVVPVYRLFYRRYGAVVRLTPGDVNEMIANMFAGRSAAVSGLGPGGCRPPGRPGRVTC